MTIAHWDLNKIAVIWQPSFSNAFFFKWKLLNLDLNTLKFVPNGSIGNKFVVVQITAPRLTSSKSLPETKMIQTNDAYICITLSQWQYALFKSIFGRKLQIYSRPEMYRDKWSRSKPLGCQSVCWWLHSSVAWSKYCNNRWHCLPWGNPRKHETNIRGEHIWIACCKIFRANVLVHSNYSSFSPSLQCV